MSTDLSALKILLESSSFPPAQNTITLTVQEFDSLCQRVRLIQRVFFRFHASLMTIRSQAKQRTRFRKRLTRQLRRQTMAGAE